MRRIVYSGIIILLCLQTSFCQHARVEVAPIAAKQAKTKEINRETILLKQNYYLMGLLPRKLEYSEAQYCPERGIKEVHQYSSFTNILFEQITIGIYSPRSLEIVCH
ncbi:hypothetical protein DLM76_07610 [Leptospira yasudae]|uniref:Lipoprotein n=1 Tax=Leptospira yasudae TaxID=2202201 RepID=A0ABX9M7G6_9LEPT|nr:hypothetical protein [Leptospira yasudae]RHX82031.1 hypothetical protein DLM77_00750 [Leptospira yasudae]RHX95175.1 hypothetical protein DLM76_07610 [Leptospira yasudae]